MGRSRDEGPKIQVALKLPQYPVGAFITRARLVRMKMTDKA